ncbi:hypothetical protein CERSUDRAFT_101078 [Gelatoporia subvermispora B]|uniref:Uncharacterized protein n=1 Tax=Ceriporiopsis subvermispora (strain B) TaxID=914234 RepID=M2Q1L0_CERS8|nr:hypothetical protein CERSUDRAFT_101078 [Gelatoporia subvermispora B]
MRLDCFYTASVATANIQTHVAQVEHRTELQDDSHLPTIIYTPDGWNAHIPTIIHNSDGWNVHLSAVIRTPEGWNAIADMLFCCNDPEEVEKQQQEAFHLHGTSSLQYTNSFFVVSETESPSDICIASLRPHGHYASGPSHAWAFTNLMFKKLAMSGQLLRYKRAALHLW